MTTARPSTALVTAIGSLSAPVVIARLKQAGYRVVGCDINPQPWVWASGCVDHYHQAPTVNDESGYVQFLLQCCERYQLDVIIPLTDIEVDVLSAQRDRFPASLTLAIAGHHTITLARDKLQWYQALQQQVPLIPTCSLAEHQPAAWKYPLFIKPRHGRSSEGVHPVHSARELRFWQETLADQSYVIQPLLAGTVMVVDVVRHAGHQQTIALARQELLRTANGAGLSVQMHDAPALIALAQQVAEAVALNGCINLEFLATRQGFQLMDINPRFSAGVEFSQLAGYDMVLNHLRCFTPAPLDAQIGVQPRIFTRHYIAAEGYTGER